MAAGRSQEKKLTDTQIDELADFDIISAEAMESIAVRRLGFSKTLIGNLKAKHGPNLQAFNSDILTKWKFKNPGSNQIYISRTHHV